MNESGGRVLRQLVAAGPRMVPGAFSALAARMIERAGFDVLYVSGAALSAGMGMPDIGLVTLDEVAAETRRITAATRIPAIVDVDTGFGDVVNVERTVQVMSRAGAAAVQIEDQRMPKRCGHLAGKELVQVGEMVAKLRAAAAARVDPELVIIARTDARGVSGFDDAVLRARAYRVAGADMIFPEALESADEFRAFRQQVDGSLLANMTEFGKSPLLGFDELAAIGYSLVLFPVTLLRLAMHAVGQGLGELKTTGTQRDLLSRMQTRQQLYDMLGYAAYERRDKSYLQPPTDS